MKYQMITRKKYCTQAVLWGCMCALFLMVNCEETIPVGQHEMIVDENGLVIGQSPIWEFDTSIDEFNNVNFVPVFHNKIIVVPASPAVDKGMMLALDIETGKEIWRWNDYVEGYDFEEILSSELLNRKNNIVIYRENNRFCAVNLDNGTTLWKDKRKGSSPSSSIQITGNHYYFSFEIDKDGVLAQVLMRGDIHSTDYEQLIELPLDSIQLFNNAYGTFYTSQVYTENGSIKAFLPFAENIDLFKGQEFNSYISYDVSNQTYDFEKVRLPDTLDQSVITRPVMIGNMITISAGDFIYGVNRHTGEVAWTRKVFANSLSDGRIITKAYKDRLFAVNETGSRRLTMELDPLTGETKWIDVGNGGSTYPPLYFLNDVMYFVSRGDGFLYAYDINVGKLLWKLRSPDDDGFMTMQVHKAESAEDEDMLVACSWKNVYRFEPAR